MSKHRRCWLDLSCDHHILAPPFQALTTLYAYQGAPPTKLAFSLLPRDRLTIRSHNRAARRSKRQRMRFPPKSQRERACRDTHKTKPTVPISPPTQMPAPSPGTPQKHLVRGSMKSSGRTNRAQPNEFLGRGLAGLVHRVHGKTTTPTRGHSLTQHRPHPRPPHPNATG